MPEKSLSNHTVLKKTYIRVYIYRYISLSRIPQTLFTLSAVVLLLLFINLTSPCSEPDGLLLTFLNNGNTHGTQNVVSSVRVAVDTTVESLGSVFTQGSLQKCLTTGVFGDVARHVVDDARDDNQAVSLLAFFQKLLSVPHRQVG